MNIEELRKIKNKNIAQQNELMFLEMKECNEKAPTIHWLPEFLARYNDSVENGVLILLSNIPDQLGTLWYGTWLTQQKEFFEFVVATTADERKIIEVESWNQVYPEVSENKEGFGKTPAYIAIEVLSELKS